MTVRYATTMFGYLLVAGSLRLNEGDIPGPTRRFATGRATRVRPIRFGHSIVQIYPTMVVPSYNHTSDRGK